MEAETNIKVGSYKVNDEVLEEIPSQLNTLQHKDLLQELALIRPYPLETCWVEAPLKFKLLLPYQFKRNGSPNQ